LRDRKTDIPLLVNHFLAQYSHELKLPFPSLQKEALDFLCQQEWMGNVRQLENIMRRVLINTRGYSIQKSDVESIYHSQTTGASTHHEDFIPQWIREELKGALALEKSDVLDSLQQRITREACLQAFALANENLSQAARILGISRLTLREKLNQYRVKTSEE
jgi:two-component system nitrogen regulation response regulator GlnG